MTNELFAAGNNTSATSGSGKAIDLSDAGNRRRLAKRIKDDIDAACVKHYSDGHRNHLGASMIGRKCARQLWSTFRWLKVEVHDGRQLRLFNRGHREEERFVEWLRWIGCEVQEYDESIIDENGKPKQFRVYGVMGHFGGSLDGRLKLPGHYNIMEPVLLCEFKTSGTGSKFANLSINGVEMEKAEHFAQMSTYGRKYGYRYALYLCINKNDDDLYIEVVKLNWDLAETHERKADDIIRSQVPPPKVAQQITAFDCKYCHFKGICHSGEAVEKNCRSCVHAIPLEDAAWGCNKFESIIPADFIPKGCDSWESIVQ